MSRCVCIHGHECLGHTWVEAPTVLPRSMVRDAEPRWSDFNRWDHLKAAVAGILILAAVVFGGASR